MMRVAWFSAGVSSFIAAYIAKPDRIVYIDIADQHPDSMRFVWDSEKLLGRPIEVISSNIYRSVEDVIRATRYVNGPAGAPCTAKLKRDVRKRWESDNADDAITYIWGFDAGESSRADRLASSNNIKCEFPLIDRGLTKEDVHTIAEQLGIDRPLMYRMGYRNNNCVGCVKGGKGYWNRIRCDFPDVFNRRAKLEREIGASCIRGCYLDELDPDAGRKDEHIEMQCSLACLGFDDGGDA